MRYRGPKSTPASSVRRPPEAERQEGEAEEYVARGPETGETEDRAAGNIVSAASHETIAPGDEGIERERSEGGVVTSIVSPSADDASEAPQYLQKDAKSWLSELQDRHFATKRPGFRLSIVRAIIGDGRALRKAKSRELQFRKQRAATYAVPTLVIRAA